MNPMFALYILFFLITLGVLGVIYAFGKRKFDYRGEHQIAVIGYVKNCIRIVSVIGAISILLITANFIPANSISFLCVPFFIVISGVVGFYYRIARDYRCRK